MDEGATIRTVVDVSHMADDCWDGPVEGQGLLASGAEAWALTEAELTKDSLDGTA